MSSIIVLRLENEELRAELEECKQDSEAYLDSAQHNMEVALAFRKENEKLAKEVAGQRWTLGCTKEALQWYKNFSRQTQKEALDLQKKICKFRFDPDKKDGRFEALSEGWLEGWDAGCRYNELSEEDACSGKTFHEDYDKLVAEKLRLEIKVDRLEKELEDILDA
jgi:hypothetical protein